MSKVVYIEREYTPTQTNGTLYCEDLKLFTLECPWKDNRAFVSCIPEGHYFMLPWESPKFGKVFIIEGGLVGKTQGTRTHCLWHSANWVRQLNGCVAVGSGWKGDMLLNSKASCSKLFDYLGWQESKLVISGK